MAIFDLDGPNPHRRAAAVTLWKQCMQVRRYRLSLHIPLSAVVIDEGRKGDSMRGKNRTAGRPTLKFYSSAGIPPSETYECLETVLVLVFRAAGLSRAPGLVVGPKDCRQ